MVKEDMLTTFIRSKPFIFGVGLEKCGTTSLSELFLFAKNVSIPSPKELDFFSSNFGRGFDWYFSHFDLSRQILFDFTPNCHWHSNVLTRIRNHSSTNVILLMLRHPLERAYSAFVHRIYWFFEKDFGIGKAQDYNSSFLDLIDSRNPFVFPSYLQVVERASNAFGAERIVTIPLEKFVDDRTSYIQSIEGKLSIEIDLDKNREFPKSNSLTVPQFLKGRDILDLDDSVQPLIKHLDDVYFCVGGMPRWIAPESEYGTLKALESKWMGLVPESASREAFVKYYATETSQLEETLGVNLDCWRTSKEFTPKTCIPLSEAAASNNALVAVWRARTMINIGKPVEAVTYLEEMVERDPNRHEFYRALAGFFLAMGKYRQARRTCELAISLAPSNGEYRVFHQYVLNRVKIQTFLKPVIPSGVGVVRR
jgi:tetratricopeptide (TPR) repeat protein